MASALIPWFKSKLPTREGIAANRWLAPVAHLILKPDLWRLNRRSVPRAFAVGLFVGPIIPIAHTAVAALLAVPARANIVIAAAVTWFINPITMPPFYYAAYRIGQSILGSGGAASISAMQKAEEQGLSSWLDWVLSEGKSLALGVFVMATVIAAVGYLLASFAWRLRVARKWRTRARLRTSAA
jgi:uncharacterized protein